MTRPKKNPHLRRQMCARFSATLDAAGWRDGELSELLGYAGRATISSVRKGTTFLDTERLAVLGGLSVRGRARPNLHWILTGDGSPFLPDKADPSLAKALSVVVLDSLGS